MIVNVGILVVFKIFFINNVVLMSIYIYCVVFDKLLKLLIKGVRYVLKCGYRCIYIDLRLL